MCQYATLLCLVQDNTLDGTLTYRAETLGRIITHAADIRRTIDPLRAVTTTLIYADGVGLRTLGSDSRGHLYTLLNHISPLRLEVDKRSDVGSQGSWATECISSLSKFPS